MLRSFIMTELFDASWEDLHLSDNDLQLLQAELLHNPKIGDVIQGTGGFRKMRFAFSGRGKSGGLRIIYLDVPDYKTLYLMLAYPKSEKDTLSSKECNELQRIAVNIKNNLRENNRRRNKNA